MISEQRNRNLGGERPGAVELFHGRTRAAQVARNLNASDAALVRNELEGATGGVQLGSRELTALDRVVELICIHDVRVIEGNVVTAGRPRAARDQDEPGFDWVPWAVSISSAWASRNLACPNRISTSLRRS